MYTGTFEVKIDDKGRIAVPYSIRENLGDRFGKAYYVWPGRTPGTLALCAENHFRQQCSDMPHSDSLTDDTFRYRQFLGAQTAYLSPDSQGRILIPERLLKRTGLGREVVLIGLFDRMEIWNRTDFETFDEQQWQTFAARRADALKEQMDRGLHQTPRTAMMQYDAPAPAAAR